LLLFFFWISATGVYSMSSGALRKLRNLHIQNVRAKQMYNMLVEINRGLVKENKLHMMHFGGGHNIRTPNSKPVF
jgi:hypothetical protein